MSRPETYDFAGYATRNDKLCSDGRIIKHGAFAEDDGNTVPLVYQHDHRNPDNILGHAVLENRDDGVYAYASFNDGESAEQVKRLIKHGDLEALSIHATGIKQRGMEVVHGIIREVSVVLAGANPGAYIQDIAFAHSDEDEAEAIIYSGEQIEFQHADAPKAQNDEKSEEDDSSEGETIADVIASMSDKQRTAMYAVIQSIAENGPGETETTDDMEHSAESSTDNNEESTLTHNVFEGTETAAETPDIAFGDVLHDAMGGTLSEAVLYHAEKYGISNVDVLFPEAHNLNTTPVLIERKKEWVPKVVGAATHSPFSRIKTQSADITDEALRAKGYKKTDKKTAGQFAVAFRTTTPQTVYVKQQMDRDDIVDITSFDVVSWLKGIMRAQLEEELARAILIGDGRELTDANKIKEDNVRPIWTDADFYSVKVDVTSGGTTALTPRVLEEQIEGSFHKYEGSGSPVLFCPRSTYLTLKQQRDANGRRMYETKAQVAEALEVSDIVIVDFMAGKQRTDSQKSKTYDLLGIIVNMSDYTIGADKGGETTFFDDFDIDFNQYKYLYETRCSGSLTRPKAALVLEADTSAPKAATGDPIVRTKAAE